MSTINVQVHKKLTHKQYGQVNLSRGTLIVITNNNIVYSLTVLYDTIGRKQTNYTFFKRQTVNKRQLLIDTALLLEGTVDYDIGDTIEIIDNKFDVSHRELYFPASFTLIEIDNDNYKAIIIDNQRECVMNTTTRQLESFIALSCAAKYIDLKQYESKI